MKSISLCLFAFVLLAAMPAKAMPTLYAQAVVPTARAAEPTAEAGFEGSPEWEKIGASLQSAWLAAKKSGDLSKRFNCFVRVQSPFDSGDRNFLQSAGFNVRLAGGTVVRGDVAANDLQGVARLPFVRKINLSSKD